MEARNAESYCSDDEKQSDDLKGIQGDGKRELREALRKHNYGILRIQVDGMQV